MLEQFVVSVKGECLRLKGLLSMTTEAQMSGFEKTSWLMIILGIGDYHNP
jgi:hypothetical protein